MSKLYAVSSGNGNDGVSHMYPDYIVATDEPYLLATLAAVSDFKAGHGRSWARANVHIDGEADYGISACFYDPPGRDGCGWCDANGAWRIYAVFAIDPADSHTCPVYDSLAECFGARLVNFERKHST